MSGAMPLSVQNRAHHAAAERSGPASTTWEPRWTCRPPPAEAVAAVGGERPRGAPGSSPNFEPACPVWIFRCVSTAMSGVTRTSTSWTTPRARAIAASASASSGASSTTSAGAGVERGREVVLALGVAVHHQVGAGEPRRQRQRDLAGRRRVGAQPASREQPQHARRPFALRANIARPPPAASGSA